MDESLDTISELRKDHTRDHDILIQIATKIDHFKDLRAIFFRHVEELDARIVNSHKRLDQINRRVDWLLISGVLAVLGLILTLWLKT